jgi:hypothetical protein
MIVSLFTPVPAYFLVSFLTGAGFLYALISIRTTLTIRPLSSILFCRYSPRT